MTKRVYVFPHKGKRVMKYLAYTLWVNPAWPGCCIHDVEVERSADAKKVAIQEHKDRCAKT